MRTLVSAAVTAALALSLAACGSSNTPAAPTRSNADYTALFHDLKSQYPKAGWTLALAKKTGDNVCSDIAGHAYEDVVKFRSGLLGGDRAQAQEIVIASVQYVCPDMSSKVPGL